MPKRKSPKKSNTRARDPEKERRWRQTLAEHAASGLARATFCRQHGINQHNFQWWQAEIARRDTEKASAAKPRVQANPFVQVHLSNRTKVPQAERCLQIDLPGGSSIRVTEATPINLLSKVLKMLEG